MNPQQIDTFTKEMCEIITLQDDKHFTKIFSLGEHIFTPTKHRPILRTCTKDHEKYAVKIISKEIIAASAHGGINAWRQLCNRILQSKKHPNFVHIHSIYEAPLNMYIVTELLQGGELYHFLSNSHTQLTEETSKYIAKQILRGAGYLHCQNIIHRDIKPENIMFRHARDSNSLKKKFELCLIDFDTARSISETENQFLLDTTVTSDGSDFSTCSSSNEPLSYNSEWSEHSNNNSYFDKRRLVGTFSFLAPEVLKGFPYSEASDLWSIGVTIFLLLNGAPPFDMHRMKSLKSSRKVIDEAFEIGIDYGNVERFPLVKDFLSKLLAYDPSDRFSSVLTALQHPWLQGSPQSVFSNNKRWEGSEDSESTRAEEEGSMLSSS